MFYVRSHNKWNNGKVYETRSVRFSNIKAAENDARRRIRDYGALEVHVAIPDGTTVWGSHKRRDVLRFEPQEDGTIKKIPLV
jgi:hypothetical protein